MRYFRFLFNILLILTIPSIAFPVSVETSFEAREIPDTSELLDSYLKQTETLRLLTYDEILNLFDEIENDEFEQRYSEEELEQLSHFLIFLARLGILQNTDMEDLEEDIQSLLLDEEPIEDLLFSDDMEYSIIPGIYLGKKDLLLCKKSKWKKKVKKFLKKHKKALIIGAVVIVGVTVVVIAASSTACAAAATAAASSKTSKKHKKKSKNHIPPTPTEQKKQSSVSLALNQHSPLANAIEDHIFEFKEELLDKSNIVYKQNDFSFKAKAKDMGSGLAHEVFDGISEIGSIVPQFQWKIIKNR